MNAFVLTAGLVATATGGRVIAGSPDRAFGPLSIDTRTMASGALFVAIRGERLDGHRFVGDAIARGAAGVLVSEMPAMPETPSAAAVVLVPDTLRALQALGQTVRRRSNARVVAITGSTGKTTTKELTADLLAVRHRVFRNRGNFNNHIGLPLSLTELHEGQDIAVVELGMNHAGEIRTLVEIAEPDVRVWTNVGDAHIGFFDSTDAIARAKAEVLEHAGPTTVAVLNADDPLVRGYAGGFPGRVLTFGETPGADVRAAHVIDRGLDGVEADVETWRGPLRLSIALPGRGQLMNVLAAVAVAQHFEVPAADIERLVARQRPVSRRGESETLPSGVRLVDDSYNASPAAVRMMLAALSATPVRGRRIAVLGEMLELGDASARLHRECGAAAAWAGVSELIAVGGPAAGALADGAIAAGLPAARVRRFADSTAAAVELPGLLRDGDVVLVKGSRGTRMDVIVDGLRESA